MARPQYNIIFMRRFHCQLNSALRQPSPAPPANRLVHTSNNAGDWPTKAVSNNNMKSKRFLCTVLACVVMISCITNAAAIQEEVADDFVEYNTESILTTRAIGEFEMTVSAKTKAIADSILSLEAGDTVRINASYSPDGSVDFGLVDEDGFFHYINVKNGSIDKTIRISERGKYKFQVRNNSSVAVKVCGFVRY